ncbi:MAG: hypothetical protein AB7E46_06965 [Desulfovibrio sp.]
MTVAKQSRAALSAGNDERAQALLERGEGHRKGLSFSILFCLLIAMLGALAGPACAETVRVRTLADVGLPQVQARQQALERALAEAVYTQARRLLPVLVPQIRLEALRTRLAPHALEYVHAYQEVPAARPAQDPPQSAAQPNAPEASAASPLELEVEVQVNQTHLRHALVRLGFFAGPQQTVGYGLRLGRGVTEADAKSLESLDLLLGLAREPQNRIGAAAEVTLERLPQGYYKAVLRHGTTALAVDASTLPDLWLEVWGKFFEEAQHQAGPGMQRLSIAGFAGVDAALDLLQAMSAWHEAVQEPKLSMLVMERETVNAQFVCRVINQQALDARLVEALGPRKLSLEGQTGLGAP